MPIKNKTLCLAALCAGLAFPLTANAADAPPMIAPPPMAPAPVAMPMMGPTDLAGCYNVVGGLPAGYSMSFCLNPDHDGTFRLATPTGACEHRLDWQDARTGVAHVDLRRIHSCDDARVQLVDDFNCMVAAPGLTCVLDDERGIAPRQIMAARAY